MISETLIKGQLLIAEPSIIGDLSFNRSVILLADHDKEKELNVKVYDSKWINETHNLKIGTLISDKSSIKVAVRNGFIELLELQLPGKKKMSSKDILNGTTFSNDSTAR